MTLRELACSVDSTPSFLSEIETGIRPAPKNSDFIIRIATVLHIDPEEALKAAKSDRERRDMKFLKKLFSQDDELAACYCRAKENFSEEEFRRIFKQIFESVFEKSTKDKGGQ